MGCPGKGVTPQTLQSPAVKANPEGANSWRQSADHTPQLGCRMVDTPHSWKVINEFMTDLLQELFLTAGSQASWAHCLTVPETPFSPCLPRQCQKTLFLTLRQLFLLPCYLRAQ